MEQRLEDSLYAKPEGITQNIKIICVDEKTLHAYGRFEDWSREKLAWLIEELTAKEQYKPAVIGLDFLLTGKAGEFVQAEERLWKACEKAGKKLYFPSPIYCTDNAAMIGAAAYYEYRNGVRHGLDLNAVPNLRIGER